MAPSGRQYWCKHCEKSFPSWMSLGGHMNLHGTRRKKYAKSLQSTPSNGAGRYGLRERRKGACRRPGSISDDDEPWTLVPKTECQLCFKVLSSRDALSVHMKAHARHDGHSSSRKLAALSIGDGDHRFAAVFCSPAKQARSRRTLRNIFPTPMMMTNGMEEVDAACTLLMLWGDAERYSACLDEHHETVGMRASRSPKTEIEPSSNHLGVHEDDELMNSEKSSSDEDTKFCSLSDVLKTKTSHECRFCGKFFATAQALANHKKWKHVSDHGMVATFPKTAVTPPRKLQLEVDNELHDLSLPALSNRVNSNTRSKSEVNQWCVEIGLQNEQMLGVF